MQSLSAWEYLSNYESFELVKDDYAVRHGRSLNTRPAREISAPFTHSRSYFKSASQSDLTVKPLLLYYGVVSLSRGLTLLLTKGSREAALAPSHGLSVQSWGDELSKDNFDVAALRIAVTSAGTYPELCEATSNLSLLRYNSSDVNLDFPGASVVTGAHYTLGDILSRTPDLSEQHARWRGLREVRHLQELALQDNGGKVLFKLSKRAELTRNLADAIFAESDFEFVSETASFEYRGVNNIATMPGITDGIGSFGIGDLYAVKRYPSAPNLSKIASAFMLSYMMGMLVRYYPTQWTGLIRGQVADGALPTLLSAVDYVERSYPLLVVDFIKRKVTG